MRDFYYGPLSSFTQCYLTWQVKSVSPFILFLFLDLVLLIMSGLYQSEVPKVHTFSTQVEVQIPYYTSFMSFLSCYVCDRR